MQIIQKNNGRPLPVLLSFLLLIALPLAAMAQVSLVIESGGALEVNGGMKIELGGDWSSNGTFEAGDGTVVFNGSGQQTISNTSPTAFNNLTVDKAGGDLVAASDFTVGGALTVTQGDLDLNGQIITLDADALLSETAGNTIKGATGYLTTTRTLGALTAENVGGLGAELTTSVSLGETEIRRGHGEQIGNGNESALRYFDILPTTNSGLNATLVFHYDESELNGHAESSFALYRSSNDGASWTQEGGTRDEIGNTVTLAGIDAFSRWTVSAEDLEPSAEISSFTGTVTTACTIELAWTTATETDNQGFHLYRSATETGTYAKITATLIPGQGTSTTPHDYTYVDPNVAPGDTWWYKLASVDLDNNEGLTGPISVEISADAFPLPTATVSGGGEICPGGTATISAALTGTGPWNLTWSDGFVQNGVSASPAMRDVSPAATTTFSVTSVTDATNCSNGGTGDATVTVDDLPMATVSGDASICTGSSATISVALTGTGPWDLVWSDGFAQNGVTASPATREVSPTENTTYEITSVTDANTCANSGTGSAAIMVVENPTVAEAGPDQEFCGSTVTLAANAPSVGTGAWSEVSGDGNGSFANAAHPTTQFTGTQGVTYTLRWTISNSPCADSQDEVEINLIPEVTTADAGDDQAVCGVSTDLAANTPSEGTGAWSEVSGDGIGSFSDVNDPSAEFTGTQGVVYTLRWTVSAPNCPDSEDDVEIDLRLDPTTAEAGPDQEFCGSTVTLAGNAPSVGTGAWSEVSGDGNGSFANAADPATQFTGTQGVNYVLRWTISNAPCTDSQDEVAVNLLFAPTPANAGADQALCGASTTLAANAPTAGTGSWSEISGDNNGVFSNAADPNATFSGTTDVTYTLRWTISAPGCPSSTDDVEIHFAAEPTEAAAGADVNICADEATLAANAPTVGQGTWSESSGDGSGNFADPNDPETTFTGTFGVLYTLRWTISNPPCADSRDEITVMIFPGLSIDLGDDREIFEGADVLLGESLTVTGGTGDLSYAWTPTDGLDDPTSANPFVTPAATTTYTLEVTDENGCVAVDEIIVTVKTNADVITDQCVEIQALIDDPETPEDALEYLEKAKEALEGALGAADDDEIEDMFGELRDAAEELEEARDEHAETDAIASILADLAKHIALEKRDEIFVCNPNPSGNLANGLTDGDNDITEGDDEYSRAYFGDAIKEYEQAWEDYRDAIDDHCDELAKVTILGVAEIEAELPTQFTLHQNYPNPFNPSTTIRFDLPEAEAVSLKIFNSVGRLVRTLATGDYTAGAYKIVWDARNDAGQRVSSGVFMYELRAGSFVAQRKLLLMK